MPCCDHIELADDGDELSDGIPEDVQAAIDRIVNEVFTAKGLPEKLPSDVVTYYADTIYKGVENGFGNTLQSVDWDSPDFNMLARLREDVWQFSSAKTYQQLKDLSQALLDKGGRLRPFNEFKRAAGAINDQQFTFLKTEYTTAVGSAQMASKWLDIEKDKHLFPLLQFEAVEDAHTSQICRSLDGVIKPVDDPFWDEYYPPNHYNCRSTVRRLSRGEITPDDKIVYPDKMHAAWKINLGKQKLVFPPDHPYYNGVPENVLAQGKQISGDPLFNVRIPGKNGGYVDITDNIDKNKIQQTQEASMLLANEGYAVKLMPEIHIKDQEKRKIYFPELAPNNGSNPDLRINGELADFKFPDNKVVDNTTISNAIRSTANKGISISLISLIGKNYNLDYVKSSVKGALRGQQPSSTIKEVWLITNLGNVIKMER